MKCREFRKRWVNRMDRSPDVLEQEDLNRHLEICPQCARLWDETQRTWAALQPTRTVRASFDFKERVMSEALKTTPLVLHPNYNSESKPWRRVQTWKPVWVVGFAFLFLATLLVLDLAGPGWFGSHPGGSPKAFGLLAQAWAGEEALFTGDGYVHLVNEILVPAVRDPNLARLRWFPMVSLEADGKLRVHQLQLSAEVGQSYSVRDEVWYDPMKGRFARVLRADRRLIYANAYDGAFVYTLETGTESSSQIVKKPVTETFQAPKNPAEFLGIAPGFQSQINEKDKTQIVDDGDAQLEDGTVVRVLRSAITGPDGASDNAMLFKIRKTDHVIAEMVWQAQGETLLTVRRALTVTEKQPGIAWDLQGIDTNAKPEAGAPSAQVMSDMVIPNVSVRRMVEKTDFEPFIFSKNPAWTTERQIVDILDVASPPKRMFMIAYRAGDKRHVVMIQSSTFNQSLGQVAKQGRLVYTSPNGFKVWSTAQDKWAANIALQSARSVILDPPAEDRSGYMLESPAGTFPMLAVNGALTETELRALIDDLVSAKTIQEQK